MNSIFSEEGAESGDIFHAPRVAHQLLEVREVFAEPVEGETLFKKPSVRDERISRRVVFEPNVVDEIEIDIEVVFDHCGVNARRGVIFLEGFCEGV